MRSEPLDDRLPLLTHGPATSEVESQEHWDQHLALFLRDVYPVFKRYGFTLGEAAVIWWLNSIGTQLDVIEATLSFEENDDA
jgi:hypothetical protein